MIPNLLTRAPKPRRAWRLPRPRTTRAWRLCVWRPSRAPVAWRQCWQLLDSRRVKDDVCSMVLRDLWQEMLFIKFQCISCISLDFKLTKCPWYVLYCVVLDGIWWVFLRKNPCSGKVQMDVHQLLAPSCDKPDLDANSICLADGILLFHLLSLSGFVS